MTGLVAGIEYKKPKVYLMNESGLGVAEYAGRTAYNSFSKSENMAIKAYHESVELGESQMMVSTYSENLNNIESSELLTQLAHVYHHDSVLEHITLQYIVKGTSRAVLQEHARHRMQSITVQSTRYTMSSVINAFVASDTLGQFMKLIKELDMFVVSDIAENIEIRHLYEKLEIQLEEIGREEFLKIALSKDNINYIHSQDEAQEEMNNPNVHGLLERFENLQNNKQKRNVGDNFKWIVTDNWKVDLVFTMNLRALSNYLKLRDSGAAYFQIRWLAEEIIKVTPQKYLELIDKKYRG